MENERQRNQTFRHFSSENGKKHIFCRVFHANSVTANIQHLRVFPSVDDVVSVCFVLFLSFFLHFGGLFHAPCYAFCLTSLYFLLFSHRTNQTQSYFQRFLLCLFAMRLRLKLTFFAFCIRRCWWRHSFNIFFVSSFAFSLPTKLFRFRTDCEVMRISIDKKFCKQHNLFDELSMPI